MKAATSHDHWRRVYVVKYPLRLERASYEGVKALGTGEITFSGPISAICGSNGVGKSTLLDVLRVAAEMPPADLRHSRLTRARLESEIASADTAYSVVTTFDPTSQTVSPSAGLGGMVVRHVDAAKQGRQIASFLHDTPDIAELLEPYSPREITGDQLETVAYVVGKDYTACRVTEITDFEDVGEWPYFEVEIGSERYGSESMGLGELSLHCLLWELWRCNSEAVILLEEPEAHVSPRSQEALLNVVAAEALKRKLWVVITTHSAGIVSRIPREHVKLAFRDSKGLRLISSPSEDQLDAVLGLSRGVHGVLLVEDVVAQAFVRSWLSSVAPEVLRRVDIRVAGSAGQIDGALRNLPKSGVPPFIVGVYDGDQSGRDLPEPWVLLPGTGSPESLLRGVAADARAFASHANIAQEKVEFALAMASGLDHHDWLTELSRHLGKSKEALIDILVGAWLQCDGSQTASDSALSQLKAALSL